MKATTCRSNVCDLPSFVRGLCKGHYGRWHRKGEAAIHTPLRAMSPPGTSKITCKLDCDKIVGRGGGQGMCRGHYARLIRTGNVRADEPLMGKRGTCHADGCDLVTSSKNYCNTHAGRVRRTGDPQAHVPIRPRFVYPGIGCLAPECPRRRVRHGYCVSHARRFEVGGEAALAKPVRIAKYEQVKCAAPECPRDAKAKGVCLAHYLRKRTTGTYGEDPIFEPLPAGTPCGVVTCDKAADRAGYCAAHYQANRLAALKADPERHEEYKAYHRKLKADERLADPEAERARAKRWREANPAKYRDAQLRRRTLLANAVRIPYSDADLKAKVAYWGSRCWVCGGPYQAIDHVKPLSRGGADILANLRPICTSDNSRKNANWPWSPPSR